LSIDTLPSSSSPVPSLPQFALGTDVVALERVSQMLQRRGWPAMQRLLNPAELAYCQSAKQRQVQVARLAVRLAAKEAVAKALQVGLNGLGYDQGLTWQEVEVLTPPEGGAPQLLLSGKALVYAEAKQLRRWQVSLSHDGPVAMAVVLGYP
jgi:holo-[acyl-carrier protein] synthase